MANDLLQQLVIDELLSTSAGKKLQNAMETISNLQRGLFTLYANDDSTALDLLKIGTVFQLFYIDLLASGKKAEDLKEQDWKNIADKVYKYAVFEEGQSYSEFVFTLYADYIDLSVKSLSLSKKVDKKSLSTISELSSTIRNNTKQLKKGKIKETDYIEACLWLSLEAMIKLISSSLATLIGNEYAQLAQAVSQLAFEYGRYVLFSKEQAILDQYIQNQHILDDKLKQEYDAYLAEVQLQADRFQQLVDSAFSPNFHEALLQSAALAREAGVKEEDLLTTLDEIDAFFME